jgi:hypothetical protein
MWLRDKLLLLNRTRLTIVLVVEQLLDILTTWWAIFEMRAGYEANPLLQVINGENGLAWLIGVKVFAATLIGTVAWISLAPDIAKRWYWWVFNSMAYIYAIVVLWNLALIVYASTTPAPFPIGG